MKTIKILSIFTAFMITNIALAHDVWVFGQNGDKFTADIGFGHDFPKYEEIPKNKQKSFAPLVVVKKDGSKIELKQTGESYHYEGDKLKEGSYLLLGEFMPTFLTQDEDGNWHDDGTKQNVKNPKYCLHASLPAKSVINIGGSKDEFVTKPAGQRLEIIPLENPANFKVDKPFKIKVLFEGKPLKTAKIEGTLEGFLKDKSAFYATTDLKGETEVLALKKGKWILKATHKFGFEDKNICDDELIIASFTFEIK